MASYEFKAVGGDGIEPRDLDEIEEFRVQTFGSTKQVEVLKTSFDEWQVTGLGKANMRIPLGRIVRQGDSYIQVVSGVNQGSQSTLADAIPLLLQGF